MYVVRWKAYIGMGLEHLILSTQPDGISAHGVVIGNRAGTGLRPYYRIPCAPDWSLRSFVIEVAGGGSLSLRVDGRGSWGNSAGRMRPELTDSIDADLAATPFTNTLPIRRLVLHRASVA